MNNENFFEACEKRKIKIIPGSPHAVLDSDIVLAGPGALLDYCVANDICSVIVDFQSAKAGQIDKKAIKQKLLARYRDLILRYYPLNTLPETVNEDPEKYYLPAWEETWNEFESEIQPTEYNSGSNNALSHIEGWIIDKGLRLHATIFDSEDGNEESNNALSEEKLIKKYSYNLQMRMQKLRKDADIEHDRIIKERRDKVLKQIAEFVKNDTTLKYMDTQKSRNEYADRLYIIWQQEKGARWLTKKEVRSIVDLEYVHIT